MVNTRINAEKIMAQLRSIGDVFLREFRTTPIPSSWEDTVALFNSIELRSTEQLQSKLRQEYPEIPFADGELELEKQKTAPSLDEFWIFDSMDGAVQYMRHVPGWTFNLVYVRNGRPKFSVVFDPLHDEMFWATDGEGAFLNGARIRVSPRPSSKFYMASTSHPPFPNQVPQLVSRIAETDRRLLEAYSFLRNFGPTALQIAYVAAGRMDVFCQQGLDTYNWLPGILIAQEAGAQVLTRGGNPWSWGSDSIFIAAPGIEPLI